MGFKTMSVVKRSINMETRPQQYCFFFFAVAEHEVDFEISIHIKLKFDPELIHELMSVVFTC